MTSEINIRTTHPGLPQAPLHPGPDDYRLGIQWAFEGRGKGDIPVHPSLQWGPTHSFSCFHGRTSERCCGMSTAASSGRPGKKDWRKHCMEIGRSQSRVGDPGSRLFHRYVNHRRFVRLAKENKLMDSHIESPIGSCEKSTRELTVFPLKRTKFQRNGASKTAKGIASGVLGGGWDQSKTNEALARDRRNQNQRKSKR